MPGKIIIDKVDMVNAPNAPLNTYVMAFDLDGILKKKDENGVITPIGYAGANASIVWSNTLWVTENPSGVPTMGDLGNPYTLDGALQAALPGQTIIIAAGSYTITENLAKDGVGVTTIGKVSITKSTAEPIINIDSTFTYDVNISGNFTFTRQTNVTNANVIRVTSANVKTRIEFALATSTTGHCVSLINTEPLVEINGDISMTTNFYGIHGDANCNLIYNGHAYTTSTTAAVMFFGGSGLYCRAIIHGNMTAPNVVGAACISTISFLLIIVNGVLNAGYLGFAATCANAGGSMVINGDCYGKISTTTSSPNPDRVDQITINGSVNNGIVAGGTTTFNIYGPVGGTIVVSNAGAKVNMYGDFEGATSGLFDVSAGILDCHGSARRLATAAYSRVTGGKVIWRGLMQFDMGIVSGDADTRAMVLVTGGEFEIVAGSLMYNTLNDLYGNCIRMAGGKVVLNGGKLKTASSNALCIVGTTQQTIQVLKGVVNRDLFTSRIKKLKITLASPVGAVGGVYSIAIPGGATSSHTVIGGDTITIIRDALLAGLAGHATLASSSAVSTDSIETVGAVAGVNFLATITATGLGTGGMYQEITQDSHLALIDDITSSTTPTTGCYINSANI